MGNLSLKFLFSVKKVIDCYVHYPLFYILKGQFSSLFVVVLVSLLAFLLCSFVFIMIYLLIYFVSICRLSHYGILTEPGKEAKTGRYNLFWKQMEQLCFTSMADMTVVLPQIDCISFFEYFFLSYCIHIVLSDCNIIHHIQQCPTAKSKFQIAL